MDTKTNAMLNKIRQTLAAERNGANLQDAQLTEAENEFCAEGCSVVEAAGYKLEGFDTNDPDAVAEALEYVAEEEGGEVAKRIRVLLAPALVEAAGPVIATVPSESNPNKSYEIRLGNDGNVYCSCPSWKYQKGVAPQDRVCKHMKALSKQLGQVSAKMGKKAPATESVGPIGPMIASHYMAEAKFISEARDLIERAGYEMEGYDDAPTEAYIEALRAIAEEEGGEISEVIGEMLAPYLGEAKGRVKVVIGKEGGEFVVRAYDGDTVVSASRFPDRESAEACAKDLKKLPASKVRCPDCGEAGERKGHQTCQYPQD